MKPIINCEINRSIREAPGPLRRIPTGSLTVVSSTPVTNESRGICSFDTYHSVLDNIRSRSEGLAALDRGIFCREEGGRRPRSAIQRQPLSSLF